MISKNALEAYKAGKRVLEKSEMFSTRGATILAFTVGLIYNDITLNEQIAIQKALYKYGRRA